MVDWTRCRLRRGMRRRGAEAEGRGKWRNEEMEVLEGMRREKGRGLGVSGHEWNICAGVVERKRRFQEHFAIRDFGTALGENGAVLAVFLIA